MVAKENNLEEVGLCSKSSNYHSPALELCSKFAEFAAEGTSIDSIGINDQWSIKALTRLCARCPDLSTHNFI